MQQRSRELHFDGIQGHAALLPSVPPQILVVTQGVNEPLAAVPSLETLQRLEMKTHQDPWRPAPVSSHQSSAPNASRTDHIQNGSRTPEPYGQPLAGLGGGNSFDPQALLPLNVLLRRGATGRQHHKQKN